MRRASLLSKHRNTSGARTAPIHSGLLCPLALNHIQVSFVRYARYYLANRFVDFSRLSIIHVAILAIWQYRLGMHWKSVFFKITTSWNPVSNCQYCQIAIQVFLCNFARYIWLQPPSRHVVITSCRYHAIPPFPVRFVPSAFFRPTSSISNWDCFMRLFLVLDWYRVR